MSRKAKAFSPAGISSFFEICDRTDDGKKIVDPERVGARGGGFVIEKGVLTEVRVNDSKENKISIFIDGKASSEAETTKTVVETMVSRVGGTYDVTVKHHVAVPIGSGFGSSAAGALSAAFALCKALDINLTYNQIGRIAHVAEVKCQTGLGTVGPLMLGGCILTAEPGAPGYASIDRIPVSPDHRIVAGFYRPIPTKEILRSPEKREMVNKWGRRTVDKILAEPSLENFMQASKEFAEKTELISQRVQKLIEAAEKAGAIGATQNMVGEAVHALVTVDKAENVVQAFKKHLSQEKIFVARISLQGAHLIR